MPDRCFVCDGRTTAVIDLPALPLTDTYGARPPGVPADGIDQQLCVCPSCGHGQLSHLLAPEVLYSGDYSFRTADSVTSTAGCEYFLTFLEALAPKRTFRSVLDVGCNDLHLLKLLGHRSERRVGIDPVLAGREHEYSDSSILVVGTTFEQAPLDEILPDGADLIVARHTLEHIHRPLETVRRMIGLLAPGGLIVLEVPGFHTLLQRRRFDQVFHQHVQYFSPASLQRLVAKAGGQWLGITENYHHWGATLVALRRGPAADAVVGPKPEPQDVRTGYAEFRRSIESMGSLLQSIEGAKYGYGAAQMLPVLAYHLGTDFSDVIAVLDDDPAKDGVSYWNLPITVQTPAPGFDLSDATVIITAVDNAVPIMRRVLQQRPKHLICPVQVI